MILAPLTRRAANVLPVIEQIKATGEVAEHQRDEQGGSSRGLGAGTRRRARSTVRGTGRGNARLLADASDAK